MSQVERMAEKATRMGEDAQDHAQKVSDQFQRAAQGGWEAAGLSISEANRGFQAVAAEIVRAHHVEAGAALGFLVRPEDRKSTRLNSSHMVQSRMPSSA